MSLPKAFGKLSREKHRRVREIDSCGRLKGHGHDAHIPLIPPVCPTVGCLWGYGGRLKWFLGEALGGCLLALPKTKLNMLEPMYVTVRVKQSPFPK